MPELIDGTELLKRLRTAFQDASEANLAVAFWGAGAGKNLGIRNGQNVRIVCNLLSGGTNPAEIRNLREKGAKVRQLNDLHAKIGIVGNISFLGSSNMSTNGLGGEGMRAYWQEANILHDSPQKEIVDLFETYWNVASDIREEDLDAASLAWSRRRKANAVIAAEANALSLVNVLRKTPEVLDDLNVRMVVYDESKEQDAEALNAGYEKARRKYGNKFDVYRNWPAMKKFAKDAYLVDYERSANGKIEFQGLYRRDEDNFASFDLQRDTFHVAYEIKEIHGMAFEDEDQTFISEAFEKYVRHRATGENDGKRDFNFPISQLGEFLRNG